MGTELMKIAEGLSLIADGVLALAKDKNDRTEDGKAAKQANPINSQNIKKAEKETVQPKDIAQKISIEDIRAVLAEKSQDGKTKEVKALLNQYGVVKLSALEEKDYPEFQQKAKVL